MPRIDSLRGPSRLEWHVTRSLRVCPPGARVAYRANSQTRLLGSRHSVGGALALGRGDDTTLARRSRQPCSIRTNIHAMITIYVLASRLDELSASSFEAGPPVGPALDPLRHGRTEWRGLNVNVGRPQGRPGRLRGGAEGEPKLATLLASPALLGKPVEVQPGRVQIAQQCGI